MGSASSSDLEFVEGTSKSENNVSSPKQNKTAQKDPDKSSKETKSEKKDESEKKAQLKQSASSSEVKVAVGKDIMISYSHANTDFMNKLKVGLESAGISVWVDVTGLKAGVDFLNKIGQAIIDAKIFVQLLSEACITSKYCQDELALAYVSNKPIFPVGMESPEQLFPKMDTGMKLQLARFNWNMFNNPDTFDQDMAEFVQKLKDFMEHGKMKTSLDRSPSDMQSGMRQNVNKHLSKKTSFSTKLESVSNILQECEDLDFWVKHFSTKKSVPWPQFIKAFLKEYDKTLKVVFAASDRDWLERILWRELVISNEEGDDLNEVTEDSFNDFCTVDGVKMSFWSRVQDQAVESYTMKEVFDMNSSVRVEAIENLGKFRSKAVVEALLDLLRDKDNNIRAVAAISLARTGENTPKVIRELMKCLGDKDRLVREGACLALGHLKATDAVPKILHLWRNDFISHVREAAQVALEQIGGNEANKAMYITKVLSEEIRTLTKE